MYTFAFENAKLMTVYETTTLHFKSRPCTMIQVPSELQGEVSRNPHINSNILEVIYELN